MTWNRTLRTLIGGAIALTAVSACGSETTGKSGNNGSTNAGSNNGGPNNGGVNNGGQASPLAESLPFFDTTAVPLGFTPNGLALTPAGVEPTVVSFDNEGGLWMLTLDGSPTLVLEGLQAPDEDEPSVVVTPDGTFHVVWVADGDVQHAFGSGTDWSTAVIDRGEKPSIAVDGDGGIHVAWVALDSSTWTSFYGSWNGTSFDAGPVRSIESRREWTGVAAHEGNVWLAGTNEDGSLWLQRRDGNAWVDEALDVSQFVRVEATFRQRIVAGDAGLAIMFASDPRTYVAWRPTGASDFSVGVVGSVFLSEDLPPQMQVGSASVAIGSIFEERASIWALAPEEWPRIAAFPNQPCSDEQMLVGLGTDDVLFAVVYACNQELEIHHKVGDYPADWESTCTAGTAKLCDLACDCGPEGPGDCGFSFSNGNSPGGNRLGCEIDAFDTLCGNSTSSPAAVEACVDALQPAMCGEYGYPVDDVCLPLIE